MIVRELEEFKWKNLIEKGNKTKKTILQLDLILNLPSEFYFKQAGYHLL